MSSRPFAEGGVTLVEMIVTIVLFSVVAAVGGLLIGKLAPSYLVSVQAEQVLSPREAALWRLSEDFRKSLVAGTSQSNFVSGCTVYLNVASGVTIAGDSVTVSQLSAEYSWISDVQQLKVSSPWVSGILLDNVTVAGSCPFTYVSGVGRSRLNVAFSYKAGVNEPVTTPVSTTFYSHAAGPYLLVLNPACGMAAGGETVTMSGTGFTPGTTGVALGGSTVVPTTVTSSTIIFTAPGPHATGLYVASMATPEGYSMLRNGYRYLTLVPNNGVSLTSITITGGGFTNAYEVQISGVAATNFVSTVDVITISAPDVGGQTGLAPVMINGISPACTLPGAFTYN